MSAQCSDFTHEDFIFAQNAIASQAYDYKTTDAGYTDAQQLLIYKSLLQAIADDFYKGDLQHLLLEANTNPALLGELVISLDTLQGSINYLKSLDTTVKEGPWSRSFPKSTKEIMAAVLQAPAGEGTKSPAPPIPAPGEDVEPDEDEDETVVKTEAVPLTTLAGSKRLISEMNPKYETPAVQFLQHVVSTSWADGRVTANSAPGFLSFKEISAKIKNQLSTRIYNYFHDRAVGTIDIVKDGEVIGYRMVFDKQPAGMDVIDTVNGVVVGKSKDFTEFITPSGKVVPVRFLIAPSASEAAEKIGYQDSADKVHEINEKTSISDDYTKLAISNADQMFTKNNGKDFQVYLAHIILKGGNWDLFMRNHYHALSDDYKSNHKTGFSEPGAAAGEDQDSAALKIHKIATPRLTKKGDALIMDPDAPYLTESDFAMVATELSLNITDLQSAQEALNPNGANNIISSEKSQYKQDILTSIYYRFFAPKPYHIDNFVDPATGESQRTEMWSYSRLATLKPYKVPSVEEYTAGTFNRQNRQESTNKLLDKSLSAIVTSLRSLTPNDAISEKNLRMVVTNIAGQGINVNHFHQTLIARLAAPGADKLYTDSKRFSNGKVQVSETNKGANDNKIDVKIKTADGEVTYTLQVNARQNNAEGEEASTELFDRGIPVTILSRTAGSKPMTPDRVAQVFSGFGFPPIVMNAKKANTIIQSLKVPGLLKNEQNASPIENARGEIEDYTLENFYMNMLFASMINISPASGVNVRSAIERHVTLPKPEIDEKGFDYPISSVLYGYRGAIADMMTTLEKEGSYKKTKNIDGNTRGVMTTMSAMKSLPTLIEALDPEGLHKGNVFNPASRRFKIYPTTYGKDGVLLDGLGKGVAKLTPHENAKLLIETAFLQTVRNSAGFNATRMQTGTQSDRLTPQLHWMESTEVSTQGNIFIKNNRPGEALNGWYFDKWKEHGTALAGLFSEMGRPVMAKDIDFVTDHKSLQRFLVEHPIAYSAIKARVPGLLRYGRIRENADGSAFVPDSALTNKTGLDTYVLERDALATHQSYFSNLERILIRRYNEALGMKFASVMEIQKHLKANPTTLTYEKLRAESDLIAMAMIEEGPDKGARIPEDVLQSIVLFKNDMLALGYIETMRRMARRQLELDGFVGLSGLAINNVAYVMGQKKIDANDAQDILLDTYFYSGQILAVPALNILSGGVSQYDIKPPSKPLFNTALSLTENGHVITNTVLAQARSLPVPGSTLSLGEISVDELLRLRKVSGNFMINRLAYIKAILDNNLAFPTDEVKAKAIILNDFTRHANDKMVSQVKRNQVYGTNLQLPRLVGKFEPGFMMGDSTKTMVIEDDEPILMILGLSGGKKTTSTDGVQMAHVLEMLKLNASLGDNESSFKWDGAAVKDLTVAKDKDGFTRIQKKATFCVFTNDMLKKGSQSLRDLYRRMNTAVTFDSKVMMVDREGAILPEHWSNISPNMWLTHGLSLGLVLDTTTNQMVESSVLLDELRKGGIQQRDFTRDLGAGRYKTAKVAVQFNNMQELWEYFGSVDNDNAWIQVAELIGTHSGAGTLKMDLSDASYPNRDAYIGKAGYLSQEKSGSHNVISWKNALDNAYSLTYTDENGKTVRRWSEVSNKNYGVMLQAEHEYDTTARQESVDSTEESERVAENTVAVISQILSAISAEGRSIKQSQNINKTLGLLTNVALEGKDSKTLRKILKKHPEFKNPTDIDILLDRMSTPPPDKLDQYDEAVKDALGELVNEGVLKSLSKRQSANGLAGELLSERFKAILSYDQKQLLPLVQSQIFADHDKDGVKIRFHGGQFIVSPSHEFMPTYDVKDAQGVSVITGLFRDDMNKYFHGDYFNALPEVERLAIDTTYPFEAITPENYINIGLSDIIQTPEGKPITLAAEKKKLMGEARDANLGYGNLEAHVANILATVGYQSRFTRINKANEQALKWTQWRRWTADGQEINAMNTDEFKAYNEITSLAKAYAKGTAYNEYFNLPVPAKMSKKAIAAAPRPETLVPVNIIREYYSDTVLKRLLVTEQDQAAFAEWLAQTNTYNLLRNVYEYVGRGVAADEHFLTKFEAHMYRMFDDTTLRWVTEPAEMYMPHMHMKAFMITPEDSLTDIIGLSDVPSIGKLYSMNILKTQEEVETFKEDHVKSERDFRQDGKYDELSEAQKIAFDEYSTKMRNVHQRMNEFFFDRLTAVYSKTKVKEKTGSKARLFVFDETNDLRKLLRAVEKKRDSAKMVGDMHYGVMQAIAEDIQNAIDNKKWNQGAKIIDKHRTKFLQEKTKILSNNFLKTLEFLSARIPAQGKQSGVVGKIKGFVTSTKNSVYGPLELILIAGMDYDIDKQNMMTWAVDTDGRLVSWKDYVNDITGEIDPTILGEKIADAEEKIQKRFASKLAYQQTLLLEAEKALKDGTQGGEDYTANYDKVTKIQNKIAALEENLEIALERSEDIQRQMFAKACQNFILQNIVDSFLDPANAIEASAAINLDKPNKSKQLPDIAHLFTTKQSLEDFFLSQKITSNVNTYSVIEYEGITMAGKSSIGINAADLKAYLAAYYATCTATPDERNHVIMKSDVSQAIYAAFGGKFGITQARQFFKKAAVPGEVSWAPNVPYTAGTVINHGNFAYKALQDVPSSAATPASDTENRYWKIALDIKELPYVSNALRWKDGNENLNPELLSIKKQLSALTDSEEDVAKQIELVRSYVDKAKKVDVFNTESQAWEDLSQLLSAATDNAKEMILGMIGVNTTTNSLVTAMIRSGIDLIDAVKIINHPTVKPVIDAVIKDTDQKLKAAKKANAAMSGVYDENQYSENLTERLFKALGQQGLEPSAGSSQETVAEYLTNPLRVAYTYAEVASEYSIATRMLGINQGLKNSAYDTTNFILSINNDLNKKIARYNKRMGLKDPLPTDFDVEGFIRNIHKVTKAKETSSVRATNQASLNALFRTIDTIRFGPNVPFIVYKNAHFAGYFRAFFRAKNVRDRLSYVNKQIEKYVLSFRKDGSTKRLTEDSHKRLSSTIYRIGIVEYLANKSSNSTVNLRGYTYDLSKVGGNGKERGRFEFIMDLPNILQTVPPGSNEFISALNLDKSSLDRETNIPIRLLKGPDLSRIDSTKKDKLLVGVAELKQSDPELYQALFFYSLITTEAGYGGGAFMDLFDVEEFGSYSKFLKENVNTVITSIENNRSLITLQNPSFLRQESAIYRTEAERKKGEDDEFSEYEGMSSAEYDQAEDHDLESSEYEEDGLTLKTTRKEDTEYKKYVVDSLNIERRKKKRLKEDLFYFQSPDTGLRYSWDDNLGIWVPMIAQMPSVCIPFNVSDSFDVEKDGGLYMGYPVKTPSSRGEVNGRILAYVSETMLEEYTKNTAKPGATTMPDDLYKVLRTADLSKKDLYIVADASNGMSLEVLSASEGEPLYKMNPGVKFDKGRVVIAPSDLGQAEYQGPVYTRVYANASGDYFSTFDEGRTLVDLDDITFEAKENSPAIYSQATVDKIKNSLRKANVTSTYTLAKVTQEFNKYREGLINNVIAVELGGNVTTQIAAEKRSKFGDQSPTTQATILRIQSDVLKKTGGISPSIVDMIQILSEGKEGMDSRYKSLQKKSQYYSSTPSIDWPVNTPYALVELVNGTDAQNTITSMTVGEFGKLMNLAGLDKADFKTYANEFLREYGADLLRMASGDIYLLKGPKIKASKQLSTINNRIEKGKPMTIPPELRYKYTKVASKEVLMMLTNHLNSRLPGVKWKLRSAAAIEKEFGKEFMSDNGLFKANGDVILNSDKATIETPFHEFGHVYLQYLRTENEAEFKNLMVLCENHPIFQAVQKAYPELNRQDAMEEVFCEILSMSVTSKLLDKTNQQSVDLLDTLSNESGNYGKVTDALADVFSGLVGTDVDIAISGSLATVINNLSDDILFGKKSMLSDFSEDTKEAVKKSRYTVELPIKEARDILINRGYIRMVCI